MDFMKFFKRQKSVQKVHTSNATNNNENVAELNGNNNSYTDSDLQLEQRNSISLSEVHNYHDDQSENNLFTQSLNDSSTKRPNSVFVKEPRGWRKSFRKLRGKKKNDGVSNSYDNIINHDRKSIDVEVNQGSSFLSQPKDVSKRWSYSPDMNEDTVPGAKELRGRLERDLSVKIEEQNMDFSHPPKENNTLNDATNQNQCDDDSNNRLHNKIEQPIDLDKTIVNTSISCDCKENTPVNSPKALYTNPVNILDSTGDTSLIYNDPPNQQNAYNNNITSAALQQSLSHLHANSNNANNESVEVEDYTNWDHLPPPPNQYTPEEDALPYDFEDIDDILAKYPSRAATLRQGGSFNQEHTNYDIQDSNYPNSLSTVKDYSLMQGNLEHSDTSTSAIQNYSDCYDENSMEMVNTETNQDSSAFNDLDTQGNSDDNISWGSNEFDDSESEISEKSEGNISSETKEDEDKSFVLRKQRITSKDFGKEVQKLKFWERSSSKRKQPPPTITNKDEEPSSFVEVVISPQRHPGPRLPDPPPDLQKYQKRRRNIVETIIQSEGSYIDSLQRLEIEYKQVLLDQKPPLLSADVVERIFYKTADILQCHQLFQIALAASSATWDEHECIGETFVASFSKSMVLECYSDFINNFTYAMDTVRKMCVRKPQFLTFLRDKQKDSSSRLNLYGLMLKPVQRFPQFIMIVQDLLKNTPSDHKDKLPLQLALTELETLAENLNQRRANDEEKAEMNRLLEASNIKLSSTTTKDGRQRRVLKQGMLQEWVFNEEGSLEKMKDVLLVLTNDMLLCCGITNRRPQRTGTATIKDMYKLKWRVTLDVLSVKDNSESENQSHALKPMVEDYGTLLDIAKLVEKLNIPHDVLTLQKVESWADELKNKIRQAEGVARQPDGAAFTVHFPEKSGDVHRMLVLPQQSAKNEWLEAINNAQKSNTQENLHGWYTADGSASENLWPSPLYLRDVLAHPNQKSLQVQCAFAFMPASHVTLLWLSCAESTVLAVVSVYYIVDSKIERVHVMQVESSVQCMEKWNPFSKLESVWLGMESGCLIEYSTKSSYHKMCEVAMPTMSTVMLMKGYKNNLYVGLLDGTLAMYTRYEGTIGLEHITSITVGGGPLNCLSPADGKLWGSCGNDLVTINLDNFCTESTRTLPTEDPSKIVSHVVQVGCGLWVAFCNSCNLHLFHLESLTLLQDLNLSRIIRDYMQELGIGKRIETRPDEQCYVTCLSSSYSFLLVGTNNGLILTMPLPKLPGSLPKITGSCKVSYHTLRGPVQFLCAPETPCTKKKAKRKPEIDHDASSTTLHTIVDDEEEINLPLPPPELLQDDESPPKIPERSPITKKNSNKSHKRTTSDGSLNKPHESSSPPRPMSSYIPNMKRNSKSIEPKRPVPPRPTDLPSLPIPSPVSTLEDDKVYENKIINKIQSPRSETTAPWMENNHNCRNCPVIIACGDGYKYLARNKKAQKDTKIQDSSTANSPAIICWKILQ